MRNCLALRPAIFEHKNAENTKERSQARRQQVKSLEDQWPALLPMIVLTAEGSGTVVLSTPASSSKDEMTIGGVYLINGIDVVAILVPEEDVWQFEAQDKVQDQLRLWTTRIPVPRKPLRLPTREQVKSLIQKKCERDEPKRCESLMNSKSKWRSMNQKCD